MGPTKRNSYDILIVIFCLIVDNKAAKFCETFVFWNVHTVVVHKVYFPKQPTLFSTDPLKSPSWGGNHGADYGYHH